MIFVIRCQCGDWTVHLHLLLCQQVCGEWGSCVALPCLHHHRCPAVCPGTAPAEPLLPGGEEEEEGEAAARGGGAEEQGGEGWGGGQPACGEEDVQ